MLRLASLPPAPNFTVSRRDVLDFAHPENLSEASGACRCKVKLNRRSRISTSSCYTSRGSLSLLLPAHAEVNTASRRANKNANVSFLFFSRYFVASYRDFTCSDPPFYYLGFYLRKTPRKLNDRREVIGKDSYEITSVYGNSYFHDIN